MIKMNIALVKSNTIINIIVVDEIDIEFLNSIKQINDYDSYFDTNIIPYPVGIGHRLDISDNLWKPINRFYPSWIFDTSIGSWMPPIPQPDQIINENQYWAWDESNQNWVLLEAPIPPVTGSIPNA